MLQFALQQLIMCQQPGLCCSVCCTNVWKWDNVLVLVFTTVMAAASHVGV
jgi:hypothetical protein